MAAETAPLSSIAGGTDAGCRKVGHFISKAGCFALHDQTGSDVWLEIDPIPLHLLDEEVEIVGQQFGTDLIWVKGIQPTKGWA
jgi:hypothetical protein